MLESLSIVITLAGGAVLGGLFYGGLWWTVRHAANFRRPGLAMLGSMMLRMATALAGFYLLAAGDWRRMLLCLLGFLLARLAVTWATRLPKPADAVAAVDPAHAADATKASHAP